MSLVIDRVCLFLLVVSKYIYQKLKPLEFFFGVEWGVGT